MLFVLDMDGVLWTMDDPIAGAREAVQTLLSRGHRVWYLTNNSSRTRADYTEKLRRFGFPATDDVIMTSAHATALVLRDEGCAGQSAYVVGERGIREELAGVGLRVLDNEDETIPDLVVVGWDRELSYSKLARAHRAVRHGARFIATNRDSSYPDAGGETLPGGGAIVAALETSTGVVPRTIGKPEPYTLELILEADGCPPQECWVVGDRLDTDVAIGKRVGTKTALVLTGVTTREEGSSASGRLRPDRIAADLATFVSYATA